MPVVSSVQPLPGCGCGVDEARARARHADARRIGGRFDPEAVAAEVFVARHEVAAQHGARPELAAVTGTAGDGDRRLRPGVVELDDVAVGAYQHAAAVVS